RSQVAIRAALLAREAAQKLPDRSALDALADRVGGGAHAWFVDDKGATVGGAEPALTPPLKDWLHATAVGDRATTSPRDAEVAARAVIPGAGISALVIAPIADWASSNIVITLIVF